MTKAELKEFLDAMDRKDDPLVKWERGRPQPEPPPRVRGLDTAPIDWSAVIDKRIMAEREHTNALLIELIAELQGQAADDLERATMSLTCEVADLRVVVADLRTVIASEKAGTVVDLPSLPSRRGLN